MADRIIGRLAYKIVGDDKDFKKALQRSTRELDRTAERFQKIGTRLSAFVTAPLLGVGAAMTKAAIEAEETQNKFNVAFRGIEEDAQSAADNLSENFGLANDEAQRLLSGTGDLLKGFGATADEALGLSTQVQALAADLASYNNLAGGTEQASKAITAALLGEREQLKQLGVVIRQEDVNQRLLEKGQADLTGQARLLAQAQATLELTVEQSTDAIGDYARSGGSAAQQIRELKSQVRDMAVELGQELLPVLQSALTQVLELVEAFQNLTDKQKATLIQVAAIAAAMGPLSLAIGTGIKAFTALRLAVVALGGASGLGLVVLALGAVATAAAVIRGPIREARESLAELAEETGIAAKELDNVARALSESEQFVDGFEEVKREVEQIAEASGRTVREVIAIGQASSRLSDEYKSQLTRLKDQLTTTEDINDEHDQAVENGAQRLQIESGVADYVREQLELKVRMRSLDGQRLSIMERLGAIDELIAANVYTEEEGLQKKIELREEEIERLRDISGYETLSEVQRRAALENIGDKVELQRTEIQRYEERIRLLREGNDGAEAHNGLTERQLALLGLVEDKHEDIKVSTDRWYDSMVDGAKSWDNVMQDAMGAALTGWGNVFEAFGEGLAAGELAIESLKAAWKNMLVMILRAIGEEYAVRAAVSLIPTALTFNPAAAAGFAAASGAAFTAAGVISSFAKGGSFYADQPQLIMVGDRPETVNIEPVKHAVPPGGSSGGLQINFNGPVFGKPDDIAVAVDDMMKRARRTGRLR